MKEKNNHIDFESDFFKKVDIKYSKSMEDVWADMDMKLSDKQGNKTFKVDFVKVFRYSAAAIFIIGLGLTAFLRFYTINVNCPNGQHSRITLPDASIVTVNANSQLSYHPYWWLFSRKLDFSGEAFFEVQKGKKFQVISDKATTTVLGTSFNIYARNNEYKVNCISGKVQVESKKGELAILQKNESSVLNQDNKFVKFEDENLSINSIAWINNEFIFTAMPLNKIYEEIERQFDVTIDGKENLKGISSFNTKRGSSPEEIIDLIGKPFGVKCTKISDKHYSVEQN